MDKRTFSAWLEQLKQLSPSQWEQLHTRIEQSDASAADRLLEVHPPTRCPHCDTTHLIRWGSAHGLPRYRCTRCGHTCNALTGSPLARRIAAVSLSLSVADSPIDLPIRLILIAGPLTGTSRSAG